MAPKKGQKMSLNAFLEDSSEDSNIFAALNGCNFIIYLFVALGSWADEMDALPSAPAPKVDDGMGDRGYGRRGDDFLSSRPDRAGYAQRDDVPLPTHPPYTAFIGNLSFDMTEAELGAFFGSPDEIKSAKIIRDRDEKPKGFGYVEFATVDGLKEALAKNGATFSSRAIRVNVAEPQKERSGFGSGDDDKFAGNWRRDGPLPDLGSQGRDGGSRRRYEGNSTEPSRDSMSDGNTDWRSNRVPPRFPIEAEVPLVRRRGSGFSTPSHEGEASPADAEEKWSIGSKFKPTTGVATGTDSQPGSRFGSMRAKGDMGPPQTPTDDSDWRKGRPARNSASPTRSVPPTPQLARRKLELLPRSASASSQPTPLSSPKSAGFSSSAKSNPFGAAKPVDVTAREAAVAEKIEKERVEVKDRVSHHPMSRQSSRQARERTGHGHSFADGDSGVRSPTVSAGAVEESSHGSPRVSQAAVVATVRPAFSFANAAGKKKPTESEAAAEKEAVKPASENQDAVAEKLAEVSV
ncbi:hypothetical protein EW145_g1409 [Phellinidium pouzarii]|uniref:RRM domain-containing protein n=1 Tax=Phellinidium pouzarii TaxID=167371 RepID=A0A4S4LGF7_9AGAM|nr:hypothetical protein EW145_g1409 [Phellinidium pouzarii]